MDEQERVIDDLKKELNHVFTQSPLALRVLWEKEWKIFNNFPQRSGTYKGVYIDVKFN